MKRIVLVFIKVIFISVLPSLGQNYNMPSSGSMNITTCSGIVSDNGGPTGNYSNNYLGTITISPSTPGTRISLNFTSFSIENSFDFFYIFDGVNTSAPLIGVFSSNPGTVNAINSSGSLTIQLLSDDSNPFAGFEASISCISLPQCDLITRNGNASPSTLIAGKTTTLACEVINQGETQAASSSIGYYLSTNNTLDSSDVFLGSSAVGQLPFGAKINKAATLLIPANTPAGNYFVLYNADFANIQVEYDENNNVSSSPITIQTAFIDLSLPTFTSNLSTVASGNIFSVTASIANVGNVFSPSSNIAFYLSADSLWDISDINLGNSTGGILVNGSSENRSATLTIPIATAPGNYYVLFFADNLNTVIETNEANNIKWLPITAAAAYLDIQIQTLTANKLVIPKGGTTTLSYVLNNFGNSILGQTITRFYLSSDNIWDSNDTLLSLTTAPSLSPDLPSSLNAIVTIPPTTPIGNYYILLLSDYNNVISETDETNNMRGIAISVVASNSDLIIKTATIGKPYYTPGLQINFTCQLFNQGDMSVSNHSTGYYYSTDSIWDTSDILLNYYNNRPIATNETFYISSKLVIPASAIPGDNYLLFYVDYLNKESETDETNNVLAKKITIVAPTVELSILSPAASSSNVIQGNVLKLSGLLKNSGTILSTNSTVGYYLSADSTWDATDTFLNYLPIAYTDTYLSSDISIDLTISATVPVGNYYIIYYADYLNLISETNELDNIKSIPFTIISPSTDLIIELTSLSAGAVTPGGSLTISNVISNIGNVEATSSNTGYYLSLDNLYDASDTYLGMSDGYLLNPLSSINQQLEVTLPNNVVLGSYYLLFIADYSKTVLETNELNNLVYLPLSILNEYIVPLTGNSSITVCSGVLYDNGGVGNYANNSNGTITIYPGVAGNSIALNFNSFDLDFWSDDGFTIYDGKNTYAPVLVAFDGNNINAPGFYSAHNSDGALTVKFSSDYYDPYYSGFDATISCLNSSSYSDLTITSSSSSKNSAPPGSLITIRSEIRNQGVNISFSSDIAYYLSTDSLRDVSDVLINFVPGAALAPDKNVSQSIGLAIPYNTVPGLYYIIPYVDNLNNTIESNELNNSKLIALTVTSSNIDFKVTKLSVNNAAIDYQSAAYNTTIYSEFKNQGLTDASNVKAGYFLSSDTLFGGGDLFLSDHTTNYLKAGNAELKYFIENIPNNTPVGNYYILYVADYVNAISETDETNNVRYFPFSIVIPNVDLVIKSPILLSPPTIQGEYITFKYTLLNKGTTKSKTPYIGYYFSTDPLLDGTDIYYTADYTMGLEGSDSITKQGQIRIPVGTTSGNYYILLVADYSNQISETNETNNVKSLAITVIAPAIDLCITNVTATNTIEIADGDAINIINYLLNKGNTFSTLSKTGYYLSNDNVWDVSDVLLNTFNNSGLYPYYSEIQYGSLKIPAGTPNGNYYIIIFADYLNSVAESDETNNAIINVPVKVTSQYLVPSSGSAAITTCGGIVQDSGGQLFYANNSNGSLTINPGTVGNFVTLRFTQFYLESCCDYIIVYDGPTTSSPVIATQYGSNNYGFLPGPFFASNPTGILTIAFHSNGTNTNAGFEAIISCEPSLPLADLITEKGKVGYPLVSQGRSIELISEVKNQGVNFATESNIGYYLSIDNVFDSTDVLLGNSTGGALATDSKTLNYKYVSIPITTIPGEYFIIFVADYLNNVNESDESNNLKFAPISVFPATIDLVINTQYVFPTIIPKGTSTTAVSVLNSIGSVSVNYSNIGYFLSTDKVFDSMDIFLNSINAYNLLYGPEEKSAYLTIPMGTPSGDYYVLFKADYNNVIAESDETNNVNFFPITITNPTSDLTIDAATPYVSSTTIVSGFWGMTRFLINNIGTTLAPKCSTASYLSSDNILDPSDIYLGSDFMWYDINANSSQSNYTSYTIPATTTAGNYYILLYIDYNNIVPETNENNNVYGFPITVVAPAIDLKINLTTNSNSTPIVGQSCYLNCKLYNLESTIAATNHIGYYLSTDTILDLSDMYLNSSTVYGLNGNSNAYAQGSVTIAIGTVPGQYYILYVADYLNEITETNETNNVAYVPITVSAIPFNDLIINNATLGPVSFVSGGVNVTAFGSFYNNGTNIISSSNVAFYISNNTIFDASDILLNSYSYPYNINKGNSLNFNKILTIPNSYKNANYYIIYVADYQNQLSESDEGNNIMFFPINLITGILDSENSNGDIVIYPNPTSGEFQLKITDLQNQDCNIVIYNNLGIEVTRRAVSYRGNAIMEEFNLTGNASGLYTIKIEIGENIYFKKVAFDK